MVSNHTLIIAIVVLAVLLVATFSYIGVSKYKQAQQQKNTITLQTGYAQAIVDVARLASTCQVVPLVIGDKSINMIAVECLQAPTQAQR